jgi:hypothetical protein
MSQIAYAVLSGNIGTIVPMYITTRAAETVRSRIEKGDDRDLTVA